MVNENVKIKVDFTDGQLDDMRAYLVEKLWKLPDSLPSKSISEHAQENRIMPAGTPRPGPLDLDYTPFLFEIMDNMSPTSSIQRTVVMKGAQLGLTMLAECVLMYYLGYASADQLFISATEGLIERWASRRLEPAIDSYDYRDIIYAADSMSRSSSRRTGDKMFSKEYFGMRLDMASAQAAATLRSTDKRILIRDEIDGAPAQLTTGEGNWLDVSYARTNSWGARRKVLDMSTPTTVISSLVYPAYMEGDQRRFFVPCPKKKCGHFQFLELERLVPVRKKTLLVDVYYKCKKCSGKIYNYNKSEMFLLGEWRPTSKSISAVLRSYHISSLYSPVGMLSWHEFYELYEKALNTPGGMRSFVNLYEGNPFKESGTRPKLEKVIENRGLYSKGTVPKGVLYLTLGADVQRGSETNKENPPRIELEILGIGAGYRTSSIDYLVFEGPIIDPYSGAWEKLHQWAIKTGLEFPRDDGFIFTPRINFFDSSDGVTMSTVYQFCERWQGTFPIKGFSALKKRKTEKADQNLDEMTPFNFKRYRAVKTGAGNILYELSTNYYKNNIYNNLKISRQDFAGWQKPGFCDFPADYPERYFKMLTAEDKYSDGSFHLPSGKRNESLDCRVYALAAADVYLDALVLDLKAAFKERGATPAELQGVDTKYALSYLAQETGQELMPASPPGV